jgi:hypothetical protein
MKNFYITFHIILFGLFSLAAQSQNAPITTAGKVTNSVPGNISVPLSVNGFISIKSLHLTLEYDPMVLAYASGTPNPAFISGFTITDLPGSNGKRNVIIAWSGLPLTLSGGNTSTLADLVFTYTRDNGLGFSALNWNDDGTSCQYLNASNQPLIDSPTSTYYQNGLVAGQLSPVTFLPEITDAFPGTLWVPLTVNDFDNIGGISLTFEYDPAIMTYANEFTSTVSGMFVGNQALPNGNMKFVIGRFGSAASLADGAELIRIKFNFTFGQTQLSWLDNGESCEYSDEAYIALYDLPGADYYYSGFAASPEAPVIKADTVTGGQNDMVTVPLTVWGFTDVNSFSLTLDYNPDVITFYCVTTDNAITSSFIASENTPGRLEMGWFDIEKTLADGTILMYLTFIYHGGTTALTWYDSGPNCEYTSGDLYLPLYDIPGEDHYKNGRVSPGLIWTGSVSTEWSLPANWADNFPPDTIYDAIITSTPTPLNWPIYTGNFYIGEQCASLTINNGAEMKVTGNMIVEPGRTFELSGSGLLRVGGDWKNFGVFNPGNGTIDFTGTIDGNIGYYTFPPTSWSALTLSTYTRGLTTIPPGSGLTGPTGDNAHKDVNIGFTFNYSGVNYTRVRINTNGWISFNLSGTDATSGINANLFFQNAPSTVLAPWWDDLKADATTTITYASDNGIFIVDFKNLLAYQSGATSRLNFQVVLHSGSNIIEFCYGTVVSGTHNALESASIGIKDVTGGLGHFIEATSNSRTITNTCLISNGNWPEVNYRFTPGASTGTPTFWKVAVSKTGASLNIKKDINVIGH